MKMEKKGKKRGPKAGRKELIIRIRELFETHTAENESLKRHLNLLAKLVILQEPELWEIYLEETKGK